MLRSAKMSAKPGGRRLSCAGSPPQPAGRPQAPPAPLPGTGQRRARQGTGARKTTVQRGDTGIGRRPGARAKSTSRSVHRHKRDDSCVKSTGALFARARLTLPVRMPFATALGFEARSQGERCLPRQHCPWRAALGAGPGHVVAEVDVIDQGTSEDRRGVVEIGDRGARAAGGDELGGAIAATSW